MSFIKGIVEPKDMLVKLIREGSRINFEECSENLTDHFFNFSVTAHSIRDWCIKFQGLKAQKKQLDQQWDKEPFLVTAKDIANSVKHFGISKYTPKLKSSEIKTSSTVEFCVGEDNPEKLQKALDNSGFRESESKEKPSYIVNFEDGTEITLNDYVFKTVNYWLTYFDDHSIPKDPAINVRHIYVNRLFWHKYT